MTPVRYSAGFLFLHSSHVLLIRKARPEWQKGKLNGIGGHLEDGETFLAAMRREFFEETGLEIYDWEQFAHYSGVYDNARKGASGGPGQPFEIAFFRAILYQIHQPELTPNADEPVAFYDCGRLPEDVVRNLNWLVPMALLSNPDDWPYVIKENR